jgi:hypothetical protein
MVMLLFFQNVIRLSFGLSIFLAEIERSGPDTQLAAAGWLLCFLGFNGNR